MDNPDKPETTTLSLEDMDETLSPVTRVDSKTTSKVYRQDSNFDWTAVSIVILIAAFFAITARLHAQPATSFVPTVVLSATGCGLLVTALRKLRTSQGIGLREAAAGGFFIASLQFAVAITYPGVVDSIRVSQITGNDFLITWILIISFAVIFSLAGAAIGHLSFAPLRPVRIKSLSGTTEKEKVNTKSRHEEETNTVGTSGNEISFKNSADDSSSQHAQRSPISFALTILLFGLAPTVTAYIFSAAYDFILSFNQFVPGPYPTLRILSALLPWQIPIPIDLNGGIQNVIIFSLLWRIPLFLGNPSLFDLQALEAYIFNGAALALLLLTMNMNQQSVRSENHVLYPGWTAFLGMEAALGLILVLPANLWVLRGLEGLIQFHGIVIPIRTITILTPPTFALNLITGPLICVSLGIALRIFLSKRSL
jgi:hypothetical protein